jgi:hypothetical protein
MLTASVFAAMVVNVSSFFAVQPMIDLAKNAAKALPL